MELSPVTAVALLLIAGYLCGRIARFLNLPALIGYLTAGVLLGPSLFDLFPETMLENLRFMTNLSLGCIAFIIGSELKTSSLRRMGTGIVILIITECLMAFLIVTAAVYLISHNLALALLFGGLAPASAPAGTVAVIQEYRARGKLTKALYAVVGFDDGLAVIIFSLTLFSIKMLLYPGEGSNAFQLTSLWSPFQEVIFSLLLGGIIGFFFNLLIHRLDRNQDTLIAIFMAVFIGTGLSARWHLSLILTCMMAGFVLVNTNKDYLVKKIRKPLQDIMELIFVFFFGLAGLHLDISALPAIGVVGITYVISRTIGLVGGGMTGGILGGMEPKIKKYIGFGILSQAGVAIGLALLASQELAKISGEADLLGGQVLTVISASSIIFEFIGPLGAKFALTRAGEVKK
ncbi:MAG: cation:proton antiporter [Desulfobia sp.]